MPKYYGCPCEGCGKPLTLQDDIVVCPDCGAPYHRTCYEKMGLCIHAPAHGAGYEWKFPYQDAQLRTCPTCGERTLRSENVCRCCGAALPPESAEQPNDRAAASAEQNRDFDYSRMYRDEMYRSFTEKVVDPVHRNVRAAFGKDELIDGVPYQDWVDFIGTAAPGLPERLQPDAAASLQDLHEFFSAAVRPVLLFLPQGVEARLRLSGRRTAAVHPHLN